MPSLFEVFGIVGIAISVLAYVPQVVHLGREHCSAGISRRAWAMWLASGLLVGALAVHRRDPVFILLQVTNLTSTAVILFLSWRFRGMVCAVHAHGRVRAGSARA
ncbi:MAG: PQ-loop domain-containing transporter [Gaiellaceae bacterium]